METTPNWRLRIERVIRKALHLSDEARSLEKEIPWTLIKSVNPLAWFLFCMHRAPTFRIPTSEARDLQLQRAIRCYPAVETTRAPEVLLVPSSKIPPLAPASRPSLR